MVRSSFGARPLHNAGPTKGFDPLLSNFICHSMMPSGSPKVGCMIPCLWHIALEISLATIQKE